MPAPGLHERPAPQQVLFDRKCRSEAPVKGSVNQGKRHDSIIEFDDDRGKNSDPKIISIY
jgi:hypothetical protein